jgi:hypothetical protein
MLHYLRIAVTALSLTACVVLVVLWVRSYWWIDTVAEWQGNPISTMNGRLFVDATFIQIESSGNYTYWVFSRHFDVNSQPRFAIEASSNRNSVLAVVVRRRRSRRYALATLVQSLQPPHAADRHDACCCWFRNGYLSLWVTGLWNAPAHSGSCESP